MCVVARAANSGYLPAPFLERHEALFDRVQLHDLSEPIKGLVSAIAKRHQVIEHVVHLYVEYLDQDPRLLVPFKWCGHFEVQIVAIGRRAEHR